MSLNFHSILIIFFLTIFLSDLGKIGEVKAIE